MIQKVLFLDIDGPIINEPLYYIRHDVSATRSCMNTQAIGYVTRICKLTGAKVVCNTMHNTHVIEGRTIKDDLVKWGLAEIHFHKEWKTNFPNYWNTYHGRLHGIHDWLETNGEADWICFDDANFTDDPRLILIDFELGINLTSFNAAMKLWHQPISKLITL